MKKIVLLLLLFPLLIACSKEKIYVLDDIDFGKVTFKYQNDEYEVIDNSEDETVDVTISNSKQNLKANIYFINVDNFEESRKEYINSNNYTNINLNNKYKGYTYSKDDNSLEVCISLENNIDAKVLYMHITKIDLELETNILENFNKNMNVLNTLEYSNNITK